MYLGFTILQMTPNIPYADKNLKDLETIVNNGLQNLYDWLTANKLTLNINKANFVIFHLLPTAKCLPIKTLHV